MNKKKLIQQKLLARILIGCAVVILVTSVLTNRLGNSTIFGLLFLIVGILTLWQVRQAEEQQKN